MATLSTRPATAADYAFLYALHRQVFYAYVMLAWGWDEAHEAADFRQEFERGVYQAICLGAEAIGAMVVEDHGDHLFLDYLALMPAHQGKGLGAILVRTLLDEAARRDLPVRLHVLKVNPAQTLYARLGFHVIGSDEYRYLMEAQPGAGHPATAKQNQRS
jgi:ribosomal protein S18 acetylase RimI-like enzyme